ncbi:MAG: hypothetical protein NTX44_09970 [Ignavibacteriales bacterium]|nr:hypothetical protein [Ignavibacteriales bacterium]
MIKRLEVLTIEQNQIKVNVEIDYIAKTISLVDINSNRGCFTRYKEYVFANRSLDYMNKWLTILDAIKYAIIESRKLLESDISEKTKLEESRSR